MPEMNGLEATMELRQHHPEFPVIILTAHDLPTLRETCIKHGAYGFVTEAQLSRQLPGLLAKAPFPRGADYPDSHQSNFRHGGAPTRTSWSADHLLSVRVIYLSRIYARKQRLSAAFFAPETSVSTMVTRAPPARSATSCGKFSCHSMRHAR
ncbi:MAG: hypothetical protein JWM83_1289 [Candidatus Angelobacter sp.]|nr:hypothetical protein [Candidatus Angelobacter sp.]